MTPERKKNIDRFIRLLLTKMEKGEKEHGRSTGGEIEEIENELLDICGWSFVRWERLQTFKSKELKKKAHPMLTLKITPETISNCIAEMKNALNAAPEPRDYTKGAEPLTHWKLPLHGTLKNPNDHYLFSLIDGKISIKKIK